MRKGTMIEIKNEINNKFPVIREWKKSFDIRFPTRILVWKFMLGKKSNPLHKPAIIVK